MRPNLRTRAALGAALTALSGLALAVVPAACNPLGGVPVVSAPTLAADPAPAAPAAGGGWGTVTGRIVWEGDVPAREKIAVTKDEAACLAKGALLSEDYIVNPKNKGIKNVVVWLIDATDAKKKLPIHPKLQNVAKLPPLEIDQPCCQFVPHIAAMREGQDLVINNSAGIAHNVHVIGGAKGPDFNVILPPAGKKVVPAADVEARPTPISVKCDIHPWMNAFIRVFPHPYFAVTDEDGKFTLKDAPAGDYRIVMWQENRWVKGDKNGVPITIKANAPTDLGEVAFVPDKKE